MAGLGKSVPIAAGIVGIVVGLIAVADYFR